MSDDAQREAFYRASRMYLDSAYGKPRFLNLEETPAGEFIQIWAHTNAGEMWEAGCRTWELRMLQDKAPQVGDTWQWVKAPTVCFCSIECALDSSMETKLAVLGIPADACDVCHERPGNPLVITMGGVMAVLVTCEVCADFPERKANEN